MDTASLLVAIGGVLGSAILGLIAFQWQGVNDWADAVFMTLLGLFGIFITMELVIGPAGSVEVDNSILAPWYTALTFGASLVVFTPWIKLLIILARRQTDETKKIVQFASAGGLLFLAITIAALVKASW